MVPSRQRHGSGVATLSLLTCPLQPEGQGTCDGPGEVPSGTHSLLLRAPRCCLSALWKWAAGIPPWIPREPVTLPLGSASED